MNSFKGIFQGLCPLLRCNYFKEHFWMSASIIFLIQIPFDIRNICSATYMLIFFWKSTTYCPKNTWRYHSSSSFSQTLIHPRNKLFVACISEGSKELKYTIAKYYITLLDSEVSIVDSNVSNITGSEAAKVLPEI